MLLDDQVLDVYADLVVVLLLINRHILDVVHLLDVVDFAVAVFVVVLWFGVVNLVPTIFDVALLVDDCDELLELHAVGFDTVLDVQGVVEVVWRKVLSNALLRCMARLG